ncbi:MAG TPA: malate dehydrogenase [Bacillota bacterium]|jgi:malate dehydrogenase
MNRKKVTIIGAGNVGATVAQLCAAKNVADTVLLDVVEGIPQGKALDMQEAAPVVGFDVAISGTNDYGDTANSDMIVITAGSARKPGMTREQLAQNNARVLLHVLDAALPLSPEAFLLIVTNPVDTMSYLTYKHTGLPKSRIMGLGGLLDSCRFQTFIAMELKVAVQDVSALVIGGHGDDMVPLLDSCSVGGVPAERLLGRETLLRLAERTRKGGEEIVSRLKSGSAYYAPGASIARMVESVILDQHRIFSVSTYLDGEFGQRDIFMSVPCVIGGGGVERILDVGLEPDEKTGLQRSSDAIRKVIRSIG